MAPPEKVNSEQKAFLEKHLNAYLEAQKKKDFESLWIPLFKEWFERWPVDQNLVLGEDLDAQKEVSLPNISRHQIEAYQYPGMILMQFYQKMYYKTHLKTAGIETDETADTTPAETDDTGETTPAAPTEPPAPGAPASRDKPPVPKKKTKTFLPNHRSHAAALYETLTQDVKDEIIKNYEAYCEEWKEKQKQEEPEGPADYAENIGNIPAVFEMFSTDFHRMTGWTCTLIAGGPDPSNGGAINTLGFHYGKNSSGESFRKATGPFYEKIVTSYQTWAQTVYTSDECAARALSPGDGAVPVPAAAVVSQPIASFTPAPTPPVDLMDPSFQPIPFADDGVGFDLRTLNSMPYTSLVQELNDPWTFPPALPPLITGSIVPGTTAQTEAAPHQHPPASTSPTPSMPIAPLTLPPPPLLADSVVPEVTAQTEATVSTATSIVTTVTTRVPTTTGEATPAAGLPKRRRAESVDRGLIVDGKRTRKPQHTEQIASLKRGGRRTKGRGRAS
ncbi:hypothetical protein ONZ45_g7379 [Pleurotus djamor]|nr:hypothetical protein ONZ45_g7379 [Pleurotus djamor]